MENALMRGEIIWWYGNEEYFVTPVSGFVSENMVQFTTEPNKDDGDAKEGYRVNLIRKEIGTVYEGHYTAIGNDSVNGRVECEVYKSIEGSEKFVLHGNWYQKGQYYWFARFKSLNFPNQ